MYTEALTSIHLSLRQNTIQVPSRAFRPTQEPTVQFPSTADDALAQPRRRPPKDSLHQ
jgi:hypothetical protein